MGWIYPKFGCTYPVETLWISSLIIEELLKGVSNLEIKFPSDLPLHMVGLIINVEWLILSCMHNTQVLVVGYSLFEVLFLCR